MRKEDYISIYLYLAKRILQIFFVVVGNGDPLEGFEMNNVFGYTSSEARFDILWGMAH